MEENPTGMQPPPPGAPMAPGPMTGRPGPVNDTSKLLAALSYPIWIVAVVALLMDPYKEEKFVRFHAIQGLALVIGYVVAYIALTIVITILSAVLPLLGLLWLVLQLAGLAFLIYVIVLALKAYRGEYFEVPLIYGLIKKYIGE